MDISKLVSGNKLIQNPFMSHLYKTSSELEAENARAFCVSASYQIADKNIEHLIIGYFDDQHRLIHSGEICSGSADAVSVPIRKITQEVLNLNANSIILVHNHPSGDPSPSQSDIKQTRDIVRILSPLGIHIDDHLIIAGDHQFSFREAGLL